MMKKVRIIIALVLSLFILTLKPWDAGVTREQVLSSQGTIVTVGAEGDYPSLQEAIDRTQGTGLVIWLIDEVHTESGIVIDHDVVVMGFGPDASIVQGAESLDLATDRVFTVEETGALYMEGITVRHGKRDEVPRGGAGILNRGQVTLDNCIVSDNRATYGVGIDNRGILLMKDSVLTRNIGIPRPPKEDLAGLDCGGSGGGMKVQRDAVAVLENCLVMDNESVRNGGGIHVSCEGSAELINTTIVGNRSGEQGGGISLRGDLELLHTTITDNVSASHKGGGIYNLGKLRIRASVISQNARNDYFLGTGGFGFYGEGFIEEISDTFVGDGSLEGVPSGDAMLLAPADHGGPTWTCAFASSSPLANAIARGDQLLDTDQRGVRRKGSTDIGAFEDRGFLGKLWDRYTR